MNCFESNAFFTECLRYHYVNKLIIEVISMRDSQSSECSRDSYLNQHEEEKLYKVYINIQRMI